MKHCIHSWWKKYIILNTVSVKKHTAFLYMTYLSMVQLFLI